MSFVKLGQIEHLGQVRVASADGGVALSAEANQRTASHYLRDGVKALDLQAAIDRVHQRYALSPRAADYSLEAMRACTSNDFNRNFDGFPRDEMLRHHLKSAAGATYRTFVNVPHHRQHLADDDREALGFILDATYNDLTPALDNCPQCEASTTSEAARSDGGTRCRECGHVVKAEFVECLIAIDNSKDPTFAHHVVEGTLNASSMGCVCDETECYVCGNHARSADEFCAHIRSAKGSWHVRDVAPSRQAWSMPAYGTASDGWKRVSNRIARQAYLTRYKLAGWEGCANFISGGREFRLAGENCRYVTFKELSRVARPADPTALSIQILASQRSLQSDALAALATAYKENTPMTTFYVVAANGDVKDTVADATLVEAVRQAEADDSVRLAYVSVEAPDSETARGLYASVAQTAKPVTAELRRQAQCAPDKPGKMETDADTTVRVPDGFQVTLTDGQGNAIDPAMPPQDPMVPGGPGAPGEPGAPGAPGTAPANQDQGNISPAELGIVPPARAASTEPGRWFRAHEEMSIDVGRENTVVAALDGTAILMLPHKQSLTTRADLVAQQDRVAAALYSGGLIGLKRSLGGTWARTAAEGLSIGDGSASSGEIGEDSTARANPIAPDAPSIADAPGEATPDHERDSRVPSSVVASAAAPTVVAAQATIDAAVAAALRTAQAEREAAERLLVARYTAAAAAGVSKAKREAFDDAVALLGRSMRVIAKRQAANLEDSHLKSAVFQRLSTEQEIGRLADGSAAITEAMPEDLATHYVEAAWQSAHAAEAEYLVRRASDLARAGADFVAAAERDAADLTPSLPRLAFAPDANVSAQVRQRIVEGSFDGGSTTPTDALTDAVRGVARAPRRTRGYRLPGR